VLSSTSSSERSLSGRWRRAFACGLLLAFMVLVVWETFWRVFGFAPAIEDDLGIWAVKRRAIDRGGPAVVLLGSSRMQLDVDPRIFRSETGLKTAMLAIDGSSPLPVLADLAESSFNGLILCSLLPQWLADGGVDKGRSARWVRKFHQQKWSSWIETRLSLFLQSHFVFRYRGLLPDQLWKNFREGEAPRPPYAPMRSDRYRPADYTLTDISKLRASRVERQREIVAQARPLSDGEFAERVALIEEAVRRIQNRGGSVVFIRLPSCGEILDLEEAAWPRAAYWDPFAAATSARTLHFADHPRLSGFDCPDGSHLDYRDAVPFTRALADVLGLGRAWSPNER
jgi:hypothetical protein